MNNINKELLVAQEEVLIKEGWVKLQPEFNLDYFLKLDPSQTSKNLGFLLSTVGENISKGPFTLIGTDVYKALDNFWSYLCPSINMFSEHKNGTSLDCGYPIFKSDFDNEEAVLEELAYLIIRKIVKSLGKPDNVIQILGFETQSIFIYEKDDINLDSLTLFSDIKLFWKDCYLEIAPVEHWHQNGKEFTKRWVLKSDKLKVLASNVCNNIGVELNINNYNVGNLNPNYKLSSFPDYIKNHTESLTKIVNNKEINRYNILITGKPGTGKTSWVQAFATEVLSSQGYLVMSLDNDSLHNLILPTYLDKICIIMNDVDSLALDRSVSLRGATEKVMAWLDGSKSSFIQPYNVETSCKIITLMTANSVANWDSAALRKGRIHEVLEFNESILYESNT